VDVLANEIERYLRRTGTPPTRFGRDAVGDPRLVFDLRRGRSIGADLTERLRRYMESAR
jgi:hypothetical protein